MGDKSPKSNQKKAMQKQKSNDSISEQKRRATAAKQVPKKG